MATFNSRPDCQAECMQCKWTCRTVNAVGVAAQHAKRHKHTVRVEVTRVIHFDESGEFAKGVAEARERRARKAAGEEP
jgi:hypothetical protein